MNKQKKILICPLDWGLGHATRCMPLISYLLEKNCQVVIAGNEMTNQLLQAEFPTLKYLELKAYNVHYSHKAAMLPLTLLKQVPRILSVIRFEHQWLQQVIRQHAIDIVISDNRYGLHST
ncbi:MAG: glycosyl transferase family 28, partial [Chitinophagaceae bacterium]|nr:glycosyl transferase family 28 [Chitinophagaceae bacterium]